MDLLDLFFPKRCVSCGKFGNYFCVNCYKKIQIIEKPLCPVCERQAIGGKTHPGCKTKFGLDGLVVASRYFGPVRDAVVKIKYKWVFDIEKVLIDLLSENLWKFELPRDLVMIPVPLHPKRKRWRGFNQADILTRDLSKRFGQKYANLLVRNRFTKPQVELKKDERAQNVKGAFAIRGSTPKAQAKSIGVEPLKGRNFILVDDVFTTGATMSECAKVLKHAGAGEVWAMAVALG